ncbi:MAG: SDR family oxidoreductase [Caldilineales bacterium]|nr:SDR family oxidoreductase [Caldilineales bacterium]
MQLKGKVALITGAAGERSIGRGIALALAAEGANIVVNDVAKPDELAKRVAELEWLGVNAMSVVCDITDRTQVDDMFARAIERFGRLDILCPNAGVVTWEPYLDITPRSVDFMFGVNIKGAFNVCQAGAKRMVAQGKGGRIVVTTSVHAHMPFADMAIYGSTKHALQTLVNTLAIELAPHNITVNQIQPGWVRSAINDPSPSVGNIDGMMETMTLIPLGRPGKAYELGRAVVYLASDDADYVTGSFVRVDGGLILSKY